MFVDAVVEQYKQLPSVRTASTNDTALPLVDAGTRPLSVRSALRVAGEQTKGECLWDTGRATLGEYSMCAWSVVHPYCFFSWLVV